MFGRSNPRLCTRCGCPEPAISEACSLGRGLPGCSEGLPVSTGSVQPLHGSRASRDELQLIAGKIIAIPVWELDDERLPVRADRVDGAVRAIGREHPTTDQDADAVGLHFSPLGGYR